MPNTANFNVNLPTVGADLDTWGDENNAAHDAWDAQLAKTGLQLLSSGTASAQATLDIAIPDTDVPGTAVPWREMVLKVTELEPVSNAVTLQALLAFDAVPTYETTDYRYSGSGVSGGTAPLFGSAGGTTMDLHGGTFTSGGGLNGGLEIRIRTPSTSGYDTILTWDVDFPDTTTSRDARFTGRGRNANSGDRLTYLRLKFSSGNISNARWALFGVPNL